MAVNPSWGLGLRPQHYTDLLALDSLPVLEIISDNYLGHQGGPALSYLDLLSDKTPLLFHGVGINLGGYAPLDKEYLRKLKDLAKRFKPRLVSDHLCFTRTEESASYELLPLPMTRATMRNLLERIDAVQNYLGQEIAVENISAYVQFKQQEFSEGEWLREIADRSGCFLLLDTNNIYVNSVNFDFDPLREILKVPLDRVREIHLAGHQEQGDYLFDTHDQNMCAEVLALTRAILARIPGEVHCILEWDRFPSAFEEMWSVFTETRDILMNASGCLNLDDVTSVIPGRRSWDPVENIPNEYQAMLIASIQGRSDANSLQWLAYKHRIHAYQQSFYGRAIRNLCEEILSLPCLAFGPSVVELFLNQFFQNNPPQTSLIDESINDFPAFILEFGEGENCQLLAVLSLLSIQSWQLLYGPNDATVAIASQNFNLPYCLMQNDESFDREEFFHKIKSLPAMGVQLSRVANQVVVKEYFL